MPVFRPYEDELEDNWIMAKGNESLAAELWAQARKDLAEAMGDQSMGIFRYETEVAGALEVASRQFAYDFPESLADTRGFSGVSLEGKRCRSDMEYAARMQQVEARAKLQGEEKLNLVQSALGTVQSDRDNASPDLKDLRDRLDVAGKQKRLLLRTARLLEDDERDKELISRKAAELGAEDYAQRDRLLETMEYMVGIRTEPLTQQHYKEMVHSLYRPQDVIDKMAREAKDFVPHQPYQPVKIHFSDFDDVLVHRFVTAAGARGLDIDQIPLDYKTERVALNNVTSYAVGTVAPTLDAMFQGLEKKMPSADLNLGMYRANLIVVNGKTVGERMKDLYGEIKGEKPAYKEWFKENNRDMTNEIVGCALAAGGRVAAFMPDVQGKIPKEPVPIQREGYEPSLLKPVTMRAWHRAWNRVGLYKERKKDFDAYQSQQAELKAMEDACERVKIDTAVRVVSYVAGVTGGQSLVYHGEAAVPMVKEMGGLQVERSAHITGPRCMLLARGHSFEDVFDETKLLQEKREVGREYLDMAHRASQEDLLKISKIYAKAIDIIGPEMERLHQNTNMRTIRNHPDCEKLNGIGNFCIDLAQETEVWEIKKAVAEYGRAPGAAPLKNEEIEAGYHAKTVGLNVYARMYTPTHMSNQAIADFNRDHQAGGDHEHQLLGAAINEVMMASYVERQKKDNPGKPLNEVMDAMCCGAILGVGTIVSSMAKKPIKTEQGYQNFVKDLIHGNIPEEAIFGKDLEAKYSNENDIFNQIPEIASNISQYIASKAAYQETKEKAPAAPTRQKIDFEQLSPKKPEHPTHRAPQADSPKKTANKGGKNL